MAGGRAEVARPPARPDETQPRARLRGRRKLKPAWWAPSGFAAIPTAALDPAHSPASPAVPALIGSGSPSSLPCRLFRVGRHDGVHLGNRLKLGQEFGSRLHEVANDPGVPEQPADVSLDHSQMQ